MNSRSGHSSMIGDLSKKVTDYQVKVKAGCRICESAKRNKISVKVHKCRINHSGSSKSMESESAVIMLKRCEEKSIDIVGLTTDEDSSTHAKCAKEVPSKKRKRKTDLNYCKKSITKQLYALKKVKGFSELTPKTISYFGRNFAYCVQQNKNEEKAIKRA